MSVTIPIQPWENLGGKSSGNIHTAKRQDVTVMPLFQTSQFIESLPTGVRKDEREV